MKLDLHHVNQSNPSSTIFYHYESQILSTRSSLFSSLKTKSERIAIVAESILNKKINSKNEKGLPHLFEIFPWLLKDLTGLDHSKAHEISINWLALYIYVSFLDDHLDLKTKIKPDEFITASVLVQTSLINLFKIVDNTKYEELFRECLIRSAKYELKDVVDQAIFHNDDFTKSDSASGKNAILFACAGAVAASMEKNSDFIIDLTGELLLAAQLLDDLTDIEEDFAQGNITIPLNSVTRELDGTTSNRINILSLMLQSRSLFNVITRIESSLSNLIVIINTSDVLIDPSNPALVYFQNLLTKVAQVRIYIESIEVSFKNTSNATQERLIEELQTKLEEIYCHT